MERYYFYIDYDNAQKGPLTLGQLIDQKISRSTLVWHEELPSWVEAGSISEIDEKLREIEISQPEVTPPPVPTIDTPLFEQYKTQNFEQKQEEKQIEKQPKTWFVESLLATLLCCMPLGIISLIFSLLSSDAWSKSDYKSALKYSNKAGLWFKITIILSVILIPLIIMISINLAIFPLFLFSDF